MTKRQAAAALRAAFQDAPYRVTHRYGVRTFQDRAAAIEYARLADGEAYAGSSLDMATGRAVRIA